MAAGQAEAALGVLVDGPAAAATAPVDHNVTAVLAGMTRRQLYDILSQVTYLSVSLWSPRCIYPTALQILSAEPQQPRAIQSDLIPV